MIKNYIGHSINTGFSVPRTFNTFNSRIIKKEPIFNKLLELDTIFKNMKKSLWFHVLLNKQNKRSFVRIKYNNIYHLPYSIYFGKVTEDTFDLKKIIEYNHYYNDSHRSNQVFADCPKKGYKSIYPLSIKQVESTFLASVKAQIDFFVIRPFKGKKVYTNIPKNILTSLCICKNDILSKSKYNYLLINSYKNAYNHDYSTAFRLNNVLDLVPFVVRSNYRNNNYKPNYISTKTELLTMSSLMLNSLYFYALMVVPNMTTKNQIKNITHILLDYKYALYGTAQTTPKISAFYYVSFQLRLSFAKS